MKGLEANDHRSPRPHRTGRADFPHPITFHEAETSSRITTAHAFASPSSEQGITPPSVGSATWLRPVTMIDIFQSMRGTK
jgi:hypothetical protein